MADEIVTELAKLELPFRRMATIREVRHESGMRMLRLVLREGHRITQVDLDADAARALGQCLLDNAEAALDQDE